MRKDIYVLGISGGFRPGNYDAAASIMKNGKLIAAVEEERLSRTKQSPGSLPKKAIIFCLKKAKISIENVNYVAYHHNTPSSIKKKIQNYFEYVFGHCPEVFCIDHHTCHASSSFFLSRFKDANIITIDFSGDNICTKLGVGKNKKIKFLEEYETPNSLGMLYSIITQYLGFKILTDEYKVMGLAAYGEYDKKIADSFSKIIEISDYGYKIDTEYFQKTSSLEQNLFSSKMISLLGSNRKANDPLNQRHKNIAYAAQKAFEKACSALLNKINKLNPSKNLCLSGGGSMNCVMNSVLLNSGLVDNIYIPHCPGDAGNSIGAALYLSNKLNIKILENSSPYLGPSFSNESIKGDLKKIKFKNRFLKEADLIDFIADQINNGKIVGWFQGKAEFGSRALGNRSIIASPLMKNMKEKINTFIKFRESFRPFAPSVLVESSHLYFKNVCHCPYMNLTFEVKVNNLPAITHVDGSARVQTVSKEENNLYYKLIKRFGEISGVPILLNTSLNVMGQPMVCSPRDALTVFGSTGLDIMVLGNYIIEK